MVFIIIKNCLDWCAPTIQVETDLSLFCVQLFKKEENSNSTPVEQACEQIINCLVENILCIEEHSAEAGTKQK